MTFKDGTTTLSTGTISTTNGASIATFTTSTLAVGTHAITAYYSGDTNDAASQSSAPSLTVSQTAPTTTTLTASAPVFAQPEKLTATVRINSPYTGTPTGSVTFMDGTTSLGSSPLSTSQGVTTASLTVTLSVGPHSITAVYGGRWHRRRKSFHRCGRDPCLDEDLQRGKLVSGGPRRHGPRFRERQLVTVLDPVASVVKSFAIGSFFQFWTVGNYVAYASSTNVTVLNLATSSTKAFSIPSWTAAWVVGNFITFGSGTSATVLNCPLAMTQHTYNVGTWTAVVVGGTDLLFEEGTSIAVLDPAAGVLKPSPWAPLPVSGHPAITSPLVQALRSKY